MTGTGQSTDADAAAQIVVDLTEAARALFPAGDVQQTLQQIVDYAAQTIEGCDFAGIFLSEGATVATSAHTDPAVVVIDSLQQRAGEGPCLEAISEVASVYAEDLAVDVRWGTFAPQAVAQGTRCVLALPLLGGSAVGALNLYARYPRAFGVVDRGKGLLLAAFAGVAISAAQAQEDERRRADNFQAALATRELIGQAQGILMERERVGSDEAFDILRRASQHLNRKLREVAQDLVDTGIRPQTEPPSVIDEP